MQLCYALCSPQAAQPFQGPSEAFSCLLPQKTFKHAQYKGHAWASWMLSRRSCRRVICCARPRQSDALSSTRASGTSSPTSRRSALS